MDWFNTSLTFNSHEASNHDISVDIPMFRDLVSVASSIPSTVNFKAATALILSPGDHDWVLEVNDGGVCRIESPGLVSEDELDRPSAHPRLLHSRSLIQNVGFSSYCQREDYQYYLDGQQHCLSLLLTSTRVSVPLSTCSYISRAL